MPEKSAYAGRSCIEYWYHTRIVKVFLLAASYVLNPSSQACSNSSLSGCMYTSIFFPEYLGPGIINVRKMLFLFIISDGGRLSGMTNTGQQLYGAAIRPKGLNPSVPTAIRQCLGSLDFSECFSSKCFHAEPSDG